MMKTMAPGAVAVAASYARVLKRVLRGSLVQWKCTHFSTRSGPKSWTALLSSSFLDLPLLIVPTTNTLLSLGFRFSPTPVLVLFCMV